MDFLLSVIYELLLLFRNIHFNFMLAAMDDDNIPVIIPKAIPQTESGWELYEKGYERRLRRLEQRQELINLVNTSRHGNIDVPDTHIDSD